MTFLDEYPYNADEQTLLDAFCHHVTAFKLLRNNYDDVMVTSKASIGPKPPVIAYASRKNLLSFISNFDYGCGVDVKRAAEASEILWKGIEVRS